MTRLRFERPLLRALHESDEARQADLLPIHQFWKGVRSASPAFDSQRASPTRCSPTDPNVHDVAARRDVTEGKES